MSSHTNVTTAASYAGIAVGNAISYAVSVDFGVIASGITLAAPVIAGALTLVIKRVMKQLTESSIDRMKAEAKARREIETADKDSLANQIESLRKENRLLMVRLGDRVKENTGAIDRIVASDTETSVDMKTQP